MFNIDSSLFFRATGVDPHSEKGSHFLGIALRSLKQTEQEFIHQELTVKELSHKVKGIALLCGATDIARICLKLELYQEVFSENRANYIFQLALASMISLCQGER